MTEERIEQMRAEYNTPRHPVIKPRFKHESVYAYEARVVAAYYGLAMRAVYIKTGPVKGWNDKMVHDHFIVVFEREAFAENGKRTVSRTMETRFHGSAKDAETGLHKTPSIYTVLACIQKYYPGTFEDFCDEFGYDTDSRQAEKTYQAVKKEYEDFAALFPEGIPDEIREIS